MYRTLLIFVMFSMVTSCSTESKLETPNRPPSAKAEPASENKSQAMRPPETGEPAMHAIQNNRLQEVMNQINTLVYSQMYSEINLSEERQLKTQEIARIAQELASSESAIIDTMPTLKLKPGEQATFAALAEKLRTSAVQMETLASQNQLQRIPATLEAITSTCTACHALFRKSRSLLEKCKDPRYTC